MRYHVAPGLPDDSKVWDIAFPPRNILIRTHSPEGKTPGGLYVEKNHKWAKIWGWVLAIRNDDMQIDPTIRAGSMVIFKRYAEETLAYDDPQTEQWLGHKLDVCLIHIDSLECVFDPPLVPLEV